ncbi:MAG: hypothetical protein LKE48_08985 [Solobacterium sp.]|jgi:hypothetical protein|nr:hypothetical protein [Solobacterium sp.]
MAHLSCPNGHGMWNGDGKPVVYAYRVKYLLEYAQQHPDFKLLDNDSAIVDFDDIVCDSSDEELDCWYCDICKGLTVFRNICCFSYQRLEKLPELTIADVNHWEDYIAFRYKEYEGVFMDFCDGKSITEVLNTYPFHYSYKVSQDKMMIYAFDQGGSIAFGYQCIQYSETSPDYEMIFGESPNEIHYKPYDFYEEKFTVNVKEGMYAYMKNGRIIHVARIISSGKLYEGTDVDDASHTDIVIKHEDISFIQRVLDKKR